MLGEWLLFIVLLEHSFDDVGPSLTLGLMGLDELHLRVLSASSDDPVERSNAKKGSCILSLLQISSLITRPLLVLKLLTKGRHWVLVVRYRSV